MDGVTPGKYTTRLAADVGIAIGPILFIIAVLGILAAAIAAGSGSFTSSTTNESNRTKAAAMIEIGQNLKVGFDRILGDGSSTVTDIVINAANTSGSTDLFSPIGGGIAAPSVTMAAAPASDVWRYPLVAIPNMGTASGCKLAMLRVTAGTCDEINSKTNAITITSTPGATAGAAVDFGDITVATLLDATGAGDWPATMAGKPSGCVNISNAAVAPAGYYFYQVLGIQ